MDKSANRNGKRIGAAANRWVESLETRRLLASVAPTVPNDPLLDYHFGKIDLPRAWAMEKGSADVIVAVLDTGVQIEHPDLAANIFTNTNEIANNGIDDDRNGHVDDVHGWDFVADDNVANDVVGHGTHVAGTIGAVGDNGIGTSGVAQHVKLLPVKVLGDEGSGTWNQIIAGIKYVTELKKEGFNIVAMNASLGGAAFPAPPALEPALAEANRQGILFVVAAGNSGLNLNGTQEVPAKFSGSLPGVITVGATDQVDALASFSNYSEALVDVAAPGVDITSTWPTDYDALLSGEPMAVSPGGGYNTISGTSMATPVVSGIAALLKSHRPGATMDQIKDAILKGAERVSTLAPLYSLPGKVRTAGRVNAYYSLLALDNTLAGRDAATHGNWVNAYGSQGYYVVGDTMNLPIGGMTVDGATEIAGRAGAANPAGLLSLQQPGKHVLNHLATTGTMKLNFNFADGESHLVTLYMADVERQGRSQVIELVDVGAGRRNDGVAVSSFQTGKYVTFRVTGTQQVWVTNAAAGRTAVVDGVFVDAAAVQPLAFVGTDDTSAGAWRTGHGSQGAFIVGQYTGLPDYARLQMSGATGVVRQLRSADKRALERLGDTGGIQAYYATPDVMTLDVNFVDGRTHNVGFHMADYERAGRVQKIEVINADSGQVADTRLVGDFADGKYLTWRLSGHVAIRITRVAGPSAVLSGIFFDAPRERSQFLGIDATTNGNWRGMYGADAAIIPGESGSLGYISALGGQWYGNAANLVNNDPRAPQSILGGFTARGSAYWGTRTTMTFDLDLGDGPAVRTAFYFADYERLNRAQRVEVVDRSTGAVLATQDIRDFAGKGKYAVFNLAGQVQVRITRLAGVSAVVNGVFFG